MLDKHTSQTQECGCEGTDCSCGKRNRFFRGKRMKADDFAIEQWYAIERRRIVNRSVIGWGVVNGFKMSKGPSKVGPGFAIDEHGREIVLAHEASLGPDNLFLVARDATGCRTLPLDQLEPGAHYLLSVHYAERRFGDAKLPDNCACDKPEKNYVCEAAVFSLVEFWERCPCGDEQCHRRCDCAITDSCGEPHRPRYDDDDDDDRRPKYSRDADVAANLTRDPYRDRAAIDELPPPETDEQHEARVRELGHSHASRSRGPHACVCHWLMEDPVDCSRPTLCEWNGYAIGPGDGVALACVRIRKTGDKCRPVEIDVTDPCGPRRFVKSNDLLYDFIRGCDLTRISWVSWHHWHRHRTPMPWALFSSMFREDDGRTKFVVRFSGPVLTDTIRFDSVVMQAATIDQSTDWRIIRRIPIARLELDPYRHDLPHGTTDQIRVYVSTYWIEDEIDPKTRSFLSENAFDLEIEVFGDGILDCHHQPIDAEAIGLEAAPSGNGSPGGTYRSCFRVEPKPRER